MTTFWILLLVLAVPLWIGVIACLFDLNNSDAAGNGLAQAFTAIYIFVLWAILAILLWIGSGRQGVPGWSAVAAILLHPASCAAAFALLHLQSQRDENRWMIVVPALAPPLLMLISACGVFPALLTGIPASGFAYAWGAVLCLSIVPWPCVAALPGIKAEREAKREAMRIERRAAFGRLTAESPIREWMAFTERYDDPLYEAALKAMRERPNRQAEVEEMLAKGDGLAFRDLARLDITATPSLCRDANALLLSKAAGFHPSRQRGLMFKDIRVEVESYESPLGWLSENGCNVDSVLKTFSDAIRTYPDWDQGALILAHLEQMHSNQHKKPEDR